MKRERIHWIDLARGFFIIAIVLGHVLSNKENLIRSWLFSFHVPAFFFLSGLCFNPGKEGCLPFLQKKLRTIVIPYVLASLLSIVLFAVAGVFMPRIKNFVDSPLENIFAMLYSNSNAYSIKYNLPLWFLPCLFVTELGAYGVSWISCKLNRSICVYLITMAVSVALTMCLKIYLPWHTETACAMMFWFVLGMALKQYKSAIHECHPQKKWVLCAAALIFVGGGTALLNIHNVSVRRDLYGLYWNYYLSATLGIMGFCLLSMTLKQSKLLEYIGRNSLEILMFHKFPILVFQDLIPQTGKYLDATVSLKGTVIAVAVLMISIAFCLIIGRFIDKYIPWFVGKGAPVRR